MFSSLVHLNSKILKIISFSILAVFLIPIEAISYQESKYNTEKTPPAHGPLDGIYKLSKLVCTNIGNPKDSYSYYFKQASTEEYEINGDNYTLNYESNNCSSSESGKFYASNQKNKGFGVEVEMSLFQESFHTLGLNSCKTMMTLEPTSDAMPKLPIRTWSVKITNSETIPSNRFSMIVGTKYLAIYTNTKPIGYSNHDCYLFYQKILSSN